MLWWVAEFPVDRMRIVCTDFWRYAYFDLVRMIFWLSCSDWLDDVDFKNHHEMERTIIFQPFKLVSFLPSLSKVQTPLEIQDCKRKTLHWICWSIVTPFLKHLPLYESKQKMEQTSRIMFVFIELWFIDPSSQVRNDNKRSMQPSTRSLGDLDLARQTKTVETRVIWLLSLLDLSIIFSG